MTVDIESFTPEMVESFERLNLFFHIHTANSEMLDSVCALVENLHEHPGKTLAPEMLIDFMESMGFVLQTVDALMHMLQSKHVGPALELVKPLSDEDKIYIRDNLQSPELDRLMAILTEDDETRVQRILLEALNIHE